MIYDTIHKFVSKCEQNTHKLWDYLDPHIFVTIYDKCRLYTKLSYKTRMHSRRMRTARSSSRPGGLHQAPPGPGTPSPGRGIPQDQTPSGPGTPQYQAPPMNTITDTCKNITFPQLRLRAVTIHRKSKFNCGITLNCRRYVHTGLYLTSLGDL